jgi:hypothetical protein
MSIFSGFTNIPILISLKVKEILKLKKKFIFIFLSNKKNPYMNKYNSENRIKIASEQK